MQIAKSKFAALPKENQNTVIDELFAHLEGIFRDMADNTDDRLARTKGIFKARDLEEAPQIPDNADSSSCPIDTLQCRVIDITNCLKRNCPEKDGKSCDNKCNINDTDDCRDDSNREVGKCMDYKERYTDSVEACHDYICDP